ncbi:MAG: hypothetical protein ACR2MU_02940 [Gaiellaceae bacterium]
MEEARNVLRRLERIEALDRPGTPAGVLLGEVRALLGEAEAWTRAERDEGADAAVEALRGALDREREQVAVM